MSEHHTTIGLELAKGILDVEVLNRNSEIC